MNFNMNFKNEKDGTVRLQTVSTSDAAQYHAFQRVTGWWEVMCQIASEYIPESHTE